MKQYRIKHISHRITLSVSLLVVLAVVLITATTTYMFNLQVTSKTVDILNKQIDVGMRAVSGKTAIINETASRLRSNDMIQISLEKANSNPSSIPEISAYLSDYLSRSNEINKTYINKIILITLDGHILDPLYALDVYSKSILSEPYFLEFQRSNYTRVLSPPITMPTDIGDRQTINMNIKFLSKDDYQNTGFMQISMKKGFFFDELDSLQLDLFDAFGIVDRSGNFVFERSNTNGHTAMSWFPTHLVNSGYQNDEINLSGNRYFTFQSVVDEYADWIVVGVLSKTRMNQLTRQQNSIVFLIGMVAIILVIMISRYVSARIVEPIGQVVHAMEQVELGEWPKPIVSGTEDELKGLASGFNSMADNLKKLIQDIYAQQEEREKAEVLALQYQLDMLQYQINPHFIHNTINVISYMALKNGQMEIRETVQAFSMLMRQIMSSAEDSITLQAEVDCIQSFLLIQKQRYGDTYYFQCELDPCVSQLLIPRFSLQPLVENALFHGIVPKESGTITLTVKKLNDCYEIRVSDNGIGLEGKTIEDLIGQNTRTSGMTHIGLKNVNERLVLHFGEESRLQCMEDNNGTHIFFMIPDPNEGGCDELPRFDC